MNIAALKCKTLVRQFHHIVDAIGNEAGISYVVNAKLTEENPLLLQEAHAMQAIELSMHSRHFPSENNEENPLLLQEAHAMQAIEHSMHSRHFPSENKEENPLLLQRQSHFAPQN